MGENRNYKLISILALIIGVVGVSLGYAAFSSTLTINTAAEERPDGTKFNVDFSSATGSVATNPVVATLNPTGVTGFTATDGVIDNTSDPTITNLKATFTEPGQTATYTFYARNIGEFVAYLNSIVFTGNKTCTPGSGTTASMVTAACDDITMTVQVGSETATDSGVASITGHTLAINADEAIVVTISYVAGGDITDGDFDVTFPVVTLTYESAD